MRLRILLTIPILLVCLSLHSQTAEQDLHNVLDKLINSHQLYFENQYLYYEKNSKTPSDTLDGVFHRNGSEQFIRMGQVEMLEADALIVTADHEDRVVSAQGAENEGNISELIDAQNLKGLLDSREAKVQYVPGKGNMKAVSITDPERPDDTLIILYDPAGWTIREAKLTTDDPFADPYSEEIQKVTIIVRYLNFTTSPKAFPYKTGQYVRKEGTRFIGSGKCKGYRVI